MIAAIGRPAALLAAALCLLVTLPACGRAANAPARETEAHQAAPQQPAAQRPIVRTALTGRVMDGANILSPETESQLTATLTALEQRRTDQLVIVTVSSLEGQSLERYSLEHFNAWGVGRRDLNNGVMIVVAPTERQVRIEVGFGLESILTDDICGEIIRTQITPHFTRGDYDGGVTAGARAIIARLDQSPPWPPRAAAPGELAK